MNQVATIEPSAKRLLWEWPIAFVFGCILFMLYPMVNAEFGIIDDHEIVNILGRNSQIRIPELFSSIRDRAIEPGQRFRPGYYVLRILEAFLVGDNAHLWHINRLLFALVSASALYLAIRIFLDPLPTGAATLLFFSGPQNEIWINLGPSESYGVPLLLLGLAWILVQLSRHHWRPTQLFPGFALLSAAGFIKESFIPLLPGTLVFIYFVIPRIFPSIIPDRPRRYLSDLLISFCLVAVIAAQFLMTVRRLRTYGHIYSAELTTTSFFYVIKPMLMRYCKDTLWFVPVMAGFFTLVPKNREEWRRQGSGRELIRAVILLTAGGLFILGPQWLVYGGNHWLAGRYFTPGNLFAVFAAVLGLYLLTTSLIERRYAELRGIVIGLLIAIAILRALGTHEEATAAAASSRAFQAKLAEIVQLKTNHPGFPLLFCSTKVFDIEPIVSVARFLAVRLPNPEQLFLNTFNWETGARTPFEKELANELRDKSLKGDEYFAKIADFRGSDGQCIAVLFSGATENYPCEYLVRVRDS